MLTARSARGLRPLLAALLLLAPISCSLFEAERPPNVLIILTDDQRADGTLESMPQVRRWLVASGVRFDRAVATTPQCCPSRASIFTGQYSHNHGVLNNTEGWAERMNERSALHRYLKDAGYMTGLFGKFLNEWNLERDPRYLDEWAIFSGGSSQYYRGGRWNDGGEIRTLDEYYTTYIARRAERFVAESAERDDERPWLLYVHPTAPHSPFAPAPEHEEAVVSRWAKNPAVERQSLQGKPRYLREMQRGARRMRAVRRLQLRTLLSVDDMVRRIFVALRENDELENTLVFFLSDNGFLWGEYGITGKSVPYLQSALIPMIVRWPERFPEGISSDELVANIDVLPTVLDAAGIEAEGDEASDGRSLLRILDGEQRRSRILLEHWGVERKGIPRWASTMTRSHQYIEYYNRSGRRSFIEYYDLAADPWQLRNLLADGRDSNDPPLRKLREQLREDRSCSRTACP